ncbi:MAG: hypothetical protein J7539_00405 [Niabella sp.]|nr:hypothetical protein [Niabella sp.]
MVVMADAVATAAAAGDVVASVVLADAAVSGAGNGRHDNVVYFFCNDDVAAWADAAALVAGVGRRP